MKPRNARVVDDFLANAPNGKARYEFVRDAHTSDLADVIGGIEKHVPHTEGGRALIDLAWMMLEARDVRGSDEARRRDALQERVMRDLANPAQPPIVTSSQRVIPGKGSPGPGTKDRAEPGASEEPEPLDNGKAVDAFVARVLDRLRQGRGDNPT